MESGAFRVKKVYFSQVSNHALRDTKLSLKAKGLYALIQSYITIEGFTLYKTTLAKQCSEGKHSFESTWKELKDRGYLVQHKCRTETGSFCYEYELLDEIIQTPENQGVGNPVSGEVGVYNNTDLIHTESNNTTTTNYITLLSDGCSFLDYYLELHEVLLKRPHKRVTKANAEKIEATICGLKNRGVDFYDWADAVERHLNALPKGNDGDILCFLTAGRRWFEAS